MFAKLLFLSPELKEEHIRIKALHNFSHQDEEPQVLGSITFDVKEGKIDEVMKRVDEYLAAAGPLKKFLSVVAEGHRLCIGVKLPNVLGRDAIEPHKDMIDKVQEDLKVD